MDIIKIIGIGLITAVAYIILKPIKPEIAMILLLFGGILIVSQTINYLIEIINTFTDLFNKTGLDSNLLKIILKIIGIGYLTEFSSSICNDTGCASLSDKIIFAGKVIILFVSLPVANKIVDIILGLLP